MERNRLTNGIGVLVDDLIHYWYESGRTEDVVIRDNVFDGFKNHPIMRWAFRRPIQKRKSFP